MRRALILAALAVVAAAPGGRWAALARADARVGAVGYRLAVANAGQCRARAPATGLVLHALGQYPARERERVRAAFGFEGPVAVEAVVPASPADRAGVAAGDTLVAVGTARLADGEGVAARDAALAAIAAVSVGEPVRLTLRRGGVERTVTLASLTGCRVAIEVVAGGGLGARTDGRRIHVGDGFARYDDEALAVVIAHELAHVVAGPAPAAGRASEDAADRLSVALLARAGFDPRAAARFWRAHGGEVERRPRDHAPPAERAAALEAAAAAIPAEAARPPAQ